MTYYGRTVILSAEVRDRFALAEWINHRNSSVRKVAETATKIALRERDANIKVGHSTVGHLISGHQKRLSTRRAELIEQALDVPRGSLFRYELTNVSQDGRRNA